MKLLHDPLFEQRTRMAWRELNILKVSFSARCLTVFALWNIILLQARAVLDAGKS